MREPLVPNNAVVSAGDPPALDALARAEGTYADELILRGLRLGQFNWTDGLSPAVRSLATRSRAQANAAASVAANFRSADQAVPRLLDVARAQIGTREGNHDDNPYGRWFGMNHAPWCAAFVSWVFAHSGATLAPIQSSKGFMRVAIGREWARTHGRLVRTPKPGDVFFILRRDGTGHTGIVEQVHPDGTITTIEGNTNGRGSRTGDRVARRVRTISSINGRFLRPIGDIDDDDVLTTLPEFGRKVRVQRRRVTKLRHRVRR